jgi:hypothetical protein
MSRDLLVRVTCRSCGELVGYRGVYAIIRPGAWWSPASAEACVKHKHGPSCTCGQPPPHALVGEQPSLFDEPIRASRRAVA